MRFYFVAGTLSATTGYLALPAGIAIRAAGLVAAPANAGFGQMTAGNASGSVTIFGGASAQLFYDGSDTGKLFFAQTSTNNALVKDNSSAMGGSNACVFWGEFLIPVSNWLE